MTQNFSENSRNNKKPSIINKTQFILGVIFLFVGSLEYFTSRPWETAYFLSKFSFLEKYFHKMPDIFGSFGGNAPELFHVLAFSLLTYSVISQNRKNLIIVGIFWLTIDSLFEIGQEYSAFFHESFAEKFPDNFLITVLDNYFHNGSYDHFDLLATLFGSLMFVLLAAITSKPKIINPFPSKNSKLF
ncbi:MAG: hypothetical protein BA864_11990 [Desulfuromonadales bacterium C00003093]|nr:MAG: hypothetical protein BA864_11990 [Desulfuromonadales bacterium C00003093]